MAEFVRLRYTDLARTAYLLTGSPEAAEDLLQSCLLRAWPKWDRIDDPIASLRHAMVNERTGRWRRLRRELLRADPPDRVIPDATVPVAERAAVLAALRTLPERMRAVLVLRYSGRVLLWGGVPPGQTQPVAVVATPTAGGGVAVLALTGDGSFPVFADGPDSRRIEGPPDTETDTAVTTGTATTGITVVRLPDPSGAVSDRLLVIGPPGAQQLRSTAASGPIPLVDGVTVLTAPRPLDAQFEAVRDGVVTASMRLIEPTAGPARFGIEMVDRW